MAPVKEQKGFTVFEIILVILVLVALGAAGFYAIQAQQKSDSSANVELNQSQQAQPVKLVTYTSTTDTFSFQYPEKWKLTSSTEIIDGVDQKSEKITITSPTGLVVSFTTRSGGIGGACASTEEQRKTGLSYCPTIETFNAEKLTSFGNYQLYLLEQQVVGEEPSAIDRFQMGLFATQDGTPAIGKQKTMGAFYGIPSKTDPTNMISNEAAYPAASEQNKLTGKEFFALPDVQEARKIFKSFSFK